MSDPATSDWVAHPSPLALARGGAGGASHRSALPTIGIVVDTQPDSPAKSAPPPPPPDSLLAHALALRVSALGAGAVICVLLITVVALVASRPGGAGVGRIDAPALLQTRSWWQTWWPAPPRDEGGGWTYESQGADWPTVRNELGLKAFPACGGTAQSPIDLPNFPLSAAAAPLAFAYPLDATWEIAARQGGEHVGFEAFLEDSPENPAASMFNASGPDFSATFSQFHVHSPSEHTTNGARWPLEVHFVHERGDRLVVFSLLYNVSETHNDVFDKILWDSHREQHDVPGVRVADMLSQAGPTYWRYEGSLTTPPCSEIVTWVVMPSTVGVSISQILAYEYSVAGVDNHRITQARGARSVVAGAR
jgi:carbonic anhydrase